MVSVVVATRDRAARVEALLDSLARQTVDGDRFEVVVVDDGSRDATPAVLGREREAERLELTVVAGSGRGPAEARNRGWRAARAPLIAFTDDDCEVEPDWLERGLEVAEASPGAIVQGPTTPIVRELGRLGAFSRTRRIERPGPWYETCNILYPRALLERLGGFDHAFGEALGEDTDLGWRARAAGADLVWANDARVHHAVQELGAAGHVRSALLGADAVLAFRRHPGLRAQALRWGVVRNPALPRLALALAALPVIRRRPAAALLAVPYLRNVAGRCRAAGGRPLDGPAYIAADLAAGFTSLRGSIRHRRLVL